MARRAEALKGYRKMPNSARPLRLRGLAQGWLPTDPLVALSPPPSMWPRNYAALPKSVKGGGDGAVAAAEREQRVAQLGEHPQRVLVATDCLSEGINRKSTSPPLHYDLLVTPPATSSEGRVTATGRPGHGAHDHVLRTDNQIDGLVLDVLRKHKTIRSLVGDFALIPANTGEWCMLMQGLLLRGGQAATDGRQLSLFDVSGDIYKELHAKWDNVTAREKQSRTLFAQRTLRVEDVAREWEAVRAAIGAGVDVQRFVEMVVQLHGGTVTRKPRHIDIRLPNHAALREAAGDGDSLAACFELPAPEGARYLTRTHQVVEGLATYVLETALDPLAPPSAPPGGGEVRGGSVARRSGVTRTRAVAIRTTLLLLRLRYHLVTQRDGQTVELLAEDCQTVGFTGAPETAQWLTSDAVEVLLNAEPAGNIAPQQATQFLERVLDGFDMLCPHLEEIAQARGQALLDAHSRVRTAARLKGTRVDVRPHLPPDVLGIYVLLPAGQ